MNGRALAALVLALVLLAAAPTAASAAKCGAKHPKTKKRTLATLALVGDESVVNVAYKRDTDPRTLLLIYTVTGCDMAGLSLKGLRTAALPSSGGKEVPDGTFQLIRKRSDPAQISLRLSIDTTKLKPGSYAGVVEVRGPKVKTARTPFSVSRSESNLLVPLAIGAIAGLVSLFWYGLQKAVSEVPVVVKWPYLFIAVIVAAIAGATAAYAAYIDQDVWTWSENGWAAALAAFTGATTGTFLVFLGNIWKEKEPTDGVRNNISRLGVTKRLRSPAASRTKQPPKPPSA